MAKRPKELTVVHRRSTPHVSEDGMWDHKPAPLYLDSSGDNPVFVYLLPEYVQKAFDVVDVRHERAPAALAELRRVLEKYVEHVKTAKAEPVMFVRYDYDAQSLDGQRLSNDETIYHNREHADKRRSIGLSYRLAFKVNGKIYSAEKRHHEIDAQFPSGETYKKKDMSRPPEIVPGRLEPYTDATEALPYTKELHEKLDRIVAAIDQAAAVLHDLDTAKDRGAALLQLGASAMPALTSG